MDSTFRNRQAPSLSKVLNLADAQGFACKKGMTIARMSLTETCMRDALEKPQCNSNGIDLEPLSIQVQQGLFSCHSCLLDQLTEILCKMIIVHTGEEMRSSIGAKCIMRRNNKSAVSELQLSGNCLAVSVIRSDHPFLWLFPWSCCLWTCHGTRNAWNNPCTLRVGTDSRHQG